MRSYLDKLHLLYLQATATPLEISSVLSNEENTSKRYVFGPTTLTIKIPISKLMVPEDMILKKCSEFIKFKRVLESKIPYYIIDLA